MAKNLTDLKVIGVAYEVMRSPEIEMCLDAHAVKALRYGTILRLYPIEWAPVKYLVLLDVSKLPDGGRECLPSEFFDPGGSKDVRTAILAHRRANEPHENPRQLKLFQKETKEAGNAG